MAKVTILYVEDSTYFRNKTSEALRECGFTIIEAIDGKEAIELIEERNSSIDLILSDILMPRTDGIELAQYNYRNKLLPFVVYTSVDETKTALKLLRYGVHDYLEKPFETDKLVSVIHNAINRWTLQKKQKGGEPTFSGNLHAISFPTKKDDLPRANEWVMKKIKNYFDEYECGKFMCFFDELLFNAYEHGNLSIHEELKAKLISDETFEDEITRLEKACDKNITVELSCLSNNIAVKITDEGEGFDYEKYLYMTEDDLIARISQPNGRGLIIAKNYFDVLRFSDNGASVFFSKKVT